MQKPYKETGTLNMPAIHAEILAHWKHDQTFKKSIETRDGATPYVFYEGPPSANGMPGIHHVMARAIKDIFCRYKTLQGFQVKRKAGWDTHGLPVELQVEKELGITKEDIGHKISIAEYNEACRKSVMKFTDTWNDLTEKMGYWVDMDNPYVTYDNTYIESVWWLLQQFYKKGLIYKGYTIQPYSPAAGTGLSTHELNQPGTYRNVKDTTVVAQFKLNPGQDMPGVGSTDIETFVLAWTTTPWTLPSNTALAVGKNIDYVVFDTYNPYTAVPVRVILAEALSSKYFDAQHAVDTLPAYQVGDKKLPFVRVGNLKGADLAGLRYEQLLPYTQPTDGDAFRIIVGDFVSTEDGTGIVHIAPSFGSDDFRVAKQQGIGSLTLVDKQGKFTAEVTDMAGEYVKEDYLQPDQKPADYKSVDVRIAIRLKEMNRAFKVEKYEHSYPHCWRTDKPVLYYPLDSWFIKTTAIKERMIALNQTINWKPASTGTGRFGNWLENLVDWNLSRSRYWGVPLPIWRTEDGTEEICIGSIEELHAEIEKAIAAGFMQSNPYPLRADGTPEYNQLDLHRPYVDDVILVSASGKKMLREKDLIDVWFDSGAMPYAQIGYPKQGSLEGNFPADFIAEGVDQTRGWFFTLHVIATAIFDQVAYKNVISNGLVLDKVGQKMSKRLGNAVDPFTTIDQYGPDALRWYMITNAQPWDNLKFDEEGIVEAQRKFFGTLYNTYAFFALYANVDEYIPDLDHPMPYEKRTEFDQWILSELQTLIQEVSAHYEDFDPTKAGRLIQDFVTEKLSNWYVRLSRRRFWKGEMTDDKRAAYNTLYECLYSVSQLMSPIAPFFADWLYLQLTHALPAHQKNSSVHLTHLQKARTEWIRPDLEASMQTAQTITSLALSLRKKHKLRVRLPLAKMMIPVLDAATKTRIEKVKELVLSEVNIKTLQVLEDTSGILIKRIKPDFKKLGPRYGKHMKAISEFLAQFSQDDIQALERSGEIQFTSQGETIQIRRDDVEIASEDIPGWVVASDGDITVALDIAITPELHQEGMARDLINRLQNIRKERNYELTDKIIVKIKPADGLTEAIQQNLGYICAEILAEKLEVTESLHVDHAVSIELEDGLVTEVEVNTVF